jgi:L-threonylcarbamoyladenylate synthase
MSTADVPAELVKAIDDAARHLAKGGLVIYPTETFYGLGAALSSPGALRRITEMKRRSETSPFPVIVADVATARSLWSEVPESANLLIHRFWPGPLTIVLPAKPGLPFEVAPRGEVGLRISSHPVARELARRAGPIVATSANPGGAKECTWVKQIDRSLLQAVDAVIDAGETLGGRPSTVIRFVSGKVAIVREGAIQRALVEACT